MRTRKTHPIDDLAGVTEVVAIIWPDGSGPKMPSKQAKVSTWAKRRATTGFPPEITRLACGPIYSRRAVAAWWERFRGGTRHQGGMRGAATRQNQIRRFCTCGGALRGIAPGTRVAPLLAAWDAAHSGDGHAPTTAMKAAAARRATERAQTRGEQDAAHRG